MSEFTLSRLEAFLYENRDQDDDNILFSFNGSRFDNMLLLDHLISVEGIHTKSIFLAGKTLLGLNFDSFRSFDLARFIPGSLKNACIDFQCKEQKSSMDHDKIQELYNKDNKNFYFNMNKIYGDDLIRYNIQDCISMAELMFKLKDEIYKLWPGANIESSMTLPGMADKLWRQTLKKGDVCSPKDRNIWEFIRKAAYAGRSEILKCGHFVGNYQSYDIKSMYAYSMIVGDFPIGQEIPTKVYMKGKLGIYNVKIIKQPQINIIPLKVKNLPYNWKSRESFDCVICSVDIEMLLVYDSVIEIGSGFYWKKSSKNIFIKFIKPFMDEKSNQDGYKMKLSALKKLKNPTPDQINAIMILKRDKINSAIRMVCKYYLCSLSGKVIQKIYTSESKLCIKSKDVLHFMQTHNTLDIETLGKCNAVFLKGDRNNYEYKPSTASPCHLGIFIYAWSRAHIYQGALSKMPQWVATDTDSVHQIVCKCPQSGHIQSICNLPLWIKATPRVQPYKIPQHSAGGLFETPAGYHGSGSLFGRFVLGNDFGMYEGELDFKTRDVYYIAPKCYALYSDVEHKHTVKCSDNCKQTHMNKIRFKGVKYRDRICSITKEEHDGLPYMKKFNNYRESKLGLSEDMFKRLTEGKDIRLVCQQIRKVLLDGWGNIFKLRSLYLFKKVSCCGNVTNVS